MNMQRRVDRTIGTMTEAEKCKLLDTHIGPVLTGHKPDAEDDERYLRGIVESQLSEQDSRDASGRTSLEERLAKLECWMREGMPGAIAELVVDCVDSEFARGGYMHHRGTWEESKAYRKGACVIDGGGTWLAIADVPEGGRPGKALEWRLIAKGDKQ